MNMRLGTFLIVTAVLACAVLRCSVAEATPILLEPCEDSKTLVTRKASPVAGKPSPILAWVTVRSGRHKPAGELCTDEFAVFDLPEPSMELWEPLVGMPYALEYEIPEPVWEPRFYWRVWPVYYAAAPRRSPPREDDPPPVAAVPEPGTLMLLGMGLLGCAVVTRKRT